MNAIDFSPLFRTSIGFDRLTRLVEETLDNGLSDSNYPPYNIVKADDNAYRITMAVAGFGENDLDIVAKENTLMVKGHRNSVDDDQVYLFRGIAGRSFQQNFSLADHMKVIGAHLDNGLLHIDLERDIPEEMKPRQISITNGTPKNLNGADKRIPEGKTTKEKQLN